MQVGDAVKVVRYEGWGVPTEAASIVGHVGKITQLPQYKGDYYDVYFDVAIDGMNEWLFVDSEIEAVE